MSEAAMNPQHVESVPLLRTDQARFYEARRGAVGPVDVVVEPGELILVVGGQGSGKSVLLRGCLGLLTPLAGQVALFGVPLANLDHDGLMTLRARCALASSSAPLVANHTLFDNVALPLRMRGLDDAASGVRQLLERLELSEVAAKRPDDVAPRLRDLALLARALAIPADLYLLDEPPVTPPARALLRERLQAGAGALVAVRHEALFPDAARRVLLELS